MNFINKEKVYLHCLYCNHRLDNATYDERALRCGNCNQLYPIIKDIPVIINESKSIFSFTDFIDRKSLFFDISRSGRILTLIGRLTPSIGGSNLGKRNFTFLSETLRKARIMSRVLVIGGSKLGEGMSDFIHQDHLDIIESDVSHGDRTQIIFDAHTIPYEDETFDCVIAQAVLEHVIHPEQCLQEVHRVLRPGGLIYAETPFMQQVHGGPYDFTRYTRSGHRKLFGWFDELKSGATAGSGTGLAWSYQYFLLSLFGYSDKARLIVKFFARITGFWIKYFDYITRLNKRDDDGASGFYFIGQKSATRMSDRAIIKYYLERK
jgi:SAM-dependent methyltransferase